MKSLSNKTLDELLKTLMPTDIRRLPDPLKADLIRRGAEHALKAGYIQSDNQHHEGRKDD